MINYHKVFGRFITFGHVETEKERIKMADLIKLWDYIPLDESNIDRIYLDTINEFVTDEKIKYFVDAYPHVKDDVIQHLLDLIDQIGHKVKYNDLHEDKLILEQFKSISATEFEAFAYGRHMYSNYVERNYDSQLLSLSVLINRINAIEISDSLFREHEREEKLLLLKLEYIELWSEQLKLKELEHRIEIVVEARNEAIKAIHKHIDDYRDLKNLLAPFVSDSLQQDHVWGMSKGNWRNIDFKLINEYASILENKQEILEIAELLGRMRQAEIEYAEEQLNSIERVETFKINHFGKSELIGITESNDLNNLLPTELALFSDFNTEGIFYKRYSERKLQTFRYINKDKDFQNQSVSTTSIKEVEKSKGPFIIAVDTSGSMYGEPERLAKVIAFAITKIALREKRKAFLISFSSHIETIELTDVKNSIEKLLEFLQMSFRGGTDITTTVKKVFEKMDTEDFQNSDLLMITDGVFDALPLGMISTIDSLKVKGNKFNALLIGKDNDQEAIQFCDNIWNYDPNEHKLRDLVTSMKEDL